MERRQPRPRGASRGVDVRASLSLSLFLFASWFTPTRCGWRPRTHWLALSSASFHSPPCERTHPTLPRYWLAAVACHVTFTRAAAAAATHSPTHSAPLSLSLSRFLSSLCLFAFAASERVLALAKPLTFDRGGFLFRGHGTALARSATPCRHTWPTPAFFSPLTMLRANHCFGVSIFSRVGNSSAEDDGKRIVSRYFEFSKGTTSSNHLRRFFINVQSTNWHTVGTARQEPDCTIVTPYFVFVYATSLVQGCAQGEGLIRGLHVLPLVRESFEFTFVSEIYILSCRNPNFPKDIVHGYIRGKNETFESRERGRESRGGGPISISWTVKSVFLCHGRDSPVCRGSHR